MFQIGTRGTQKAQLSAMLLVEEYWRRADKKAYLAFLRLHADDHPGSRGHCYYLAVKQLDPR